MSHSAWCEPLSARGRFEISWRVFLLVILVRLFLYASHHLSICRLLSLSSHLSVSWSLIAFYVKHKILPTAAAATASLWGRAWCVLCNQCMVDINKSKRNILSSTVFGCVMEIPLQVSLYCALIKPLFHPHFSLNVSLHTKISTQQQRLNKFN